jgi:hypothetical protein
MNFGEGGKCLVCRYVGLEREVGVIWVGMEWDEEWG